MIHEFQLDSVSSGDQGMAFYWRGNQLFAKQAKTSDSDRIWTTFLMDMRDPIEVKIYSNIFYR